MKVFMESAVMTLAVCFTNFGPYHLARLRALAARLCPAGHRLIAYEVAGQEQTYPWCRTETTNHSSGSLCSPTGSWRRSRQPIAGVR